MKLGRRPITPEPDPFVEILGKAANASMTKLYGDGVRKGMEMVLLLLLDLPNDTSAPPYKGPLDPDARRWAEAALGRIKALEVEMARGDH